MDNQKTAVNIIVCDCDGVLTDGKLNIDHTGEKMFKSFHTRDIRAIRELVANGYEFYIVTADDWPGGKEFAEKVGAEFIYLRDKSKIREHIGAHPFIAVGDDVWDIPMMLQAQIGYCPADAIKLPAAALYSGGRLKTKGGHGVIAELLQFLL